MNQVSELSGVAGVTGVSEGAGVPEEPDAREVTVSLSVTGPDRMRELGRALAALLRPGDLLVLTGELGAGKTTLTRGIGEGLNVRGPVTSPTFVIARVHPPLGDGPPLVHADAYRLGGDLEELEDLDLDAALAESVVVVEWGEGRVEGLAEDRLHLVLRHPDGAPDEQRVVTLTGHGARWAGARERLAALGRGTA
ncbi:tRNA (adenosine(37)-N6)-threonylcarbamoyltransferase complex ATPase subunit type 1 TsaE [Streptomyces sp. 4N509B]|uniref:tRNA (adenosine(37)-N6)-threonylcarbamoyltransferase complex ATPase subunit type 1 TsaE n=1 Tax=Streptomyces sp. 4N509B TaxID=3457413 RepID=UPI003FD2A005